VLDGLERKLVAVVADAVTGRAHLDVVQAAGPGDDPTAGRTVARLGVESMSAETGFDRDVVDIGGTPSAPVSRRVLPLGFTATARFSARPTDATPAERTAARTRLLGDISAISHALADGRYQGGSMFAVAGDSGFTVRAFDFDAGDLDPEPPDGADPALLWATLRWRGRAIIWPTEPPQPEGVTLAIDIELAATPLTLDPRDRVVRQGGSTAVRISGVTGRRLAAVDPPTDDPLAVAISVTSDLPPADRGRVTGGTPGTDPGVQIVSITEPVSTVTYTAPSVPLGDVRVEFLTVHYATREGGRGVLIDTLPIRLVPS